MQPSRQLSASIALSTALLALFALSTGMPRSEPVRMDLPERAAPLGLPH